MQHGPYRVYDWLGDFSWMACFTTTLVLAVWTPAKGRALLLVGSVLLIASRLFLGDSTLIQLPLLGAMNVYAVGYLVRPSKFEPGGRQTSGGNASPAAPGRSSEVAEGPTDVR